MDDDAIRTLVTRLARPHKSGGKVIERAAILACGSESADVLMWITDHAGEPEAAVATVSRRGGLHSGRLEAGDAAHPLPPRRYVLPAGALQ